MILEGDERRLLVAYLQALLTRAGRSVPGSRARDLYARLEKPSSRPEAIAETRLLCEEVRDEGAAWERVRRGVAFFLARFDRADPTGGVHRHLHVGSPGPGTDIVRRDDPSVPIGGNMPVEVPHHPPVDPADIRLLDLLDSAARMRAICLRCFFDLWEFPEGHRRRRAGHGKG